MVWIVFVIKRIIRNWQFILALTIGMILSTTLLASAPLLVDAVIEFGLQRTLSDSNPLNTHLRLFVTVDPRPDQIIDINSNVASIIEEYLDKYGAHVVHSVESFWLSPWFDGQLKQNDRVNIRLFDSVEEHAYLVVGKWPSSQQFFVNNMNVIDVVVGEEMAHTYELSVGDILPLSYKRTDGDAQLYMRMSGIIRPYDYSDDIWFDAFGPFQSSSSGRWQTQNNALVNEEAFYTIAQNWFPKSGVTLSWHVIIDRRTITLQNANNLIISIDKLRKTLLEGNPRIVTQTNLPEVVSSFTKQASIIRAPIYLLLSEIIILTLYYVVVMSANSMRFVEGEMTQLVSRGASAKQLVLLASIEAIILSTLALMCGPFLAKLLLQSLLWVGPLVDVVPEDWHVALNEASWITAGVGALSVFLSQLIPLKATIQRSTVAHQRQLSRPQAKPMWQRLYLDVIIILVGILLLWRLRQYGSIIAPNPKLPTVDWLLLLSPLALLLGSAAILLRIFPLLLRFLGLITNREKGITAILGLWPISRHPNHVTRLVLMLTLAMALGVLTSGLNSTLDHSDKERAIYATGGDVRVIVNRPIMADNILNVSGADTVLRIWRGMGSTRIRGKTPRFEVLAVPSDLSEYIHFRDDFSDIDMGGMLKSLIQPEVSVLSDYSSDIFLPGHPSTFGFWVFAPPEGSTGLPGVDGSTLLGQSNHSRIAFNIKLLTAEGYYLSLPLSSVASDGCQSTCWDNETCNAEYPWKGLSSYTCDWEYFATTIPELPENAYPLQLDALWLQNRVRYARGSGISTQPNVMILLTIDDITTMDRAVGTVSLVEDFEKPLTIWTIDTGGSQFRAQGGYTGPSSLMLMPFFGRIGQRISLRPYTSAIVQPIPVIISPEFTTATGLSEGDTFLSWLDSLPNLTFRIVGSVNYFNTMYENQATSLGTPDAGFILVDLDTILPRLNALTHQVVNPNELWIIGNDAKTEQIKRIPGVTNLMSMKVTQQNFKAIPIAMGLRVVTFFGYTVTSLLSLVAFFTHFYTSGLQRTTMYGVLRSLGLAPRQLYLSLVLEQLVLVIWGIGIGTLLGLALNKLVLPGLPISLGGSIPVPPFVPQNNWAALWTTYAVLTGSYLVLLIMSTFLLWRIKLHQILRVGQE